MSTRTFAGVAASAVAAIAAVTFAMPTSAHTTADVVAVPAGAAATVSLKPAHGCGESPTTEVVIRAPMEGAQAGQVEGWTATAEADGKGNTVVRWTGGSLPSDQAGAFPVRFTAPDTPGELLTFPAIQRCANGEELAWINGDPQSDFPAPRILVLAAGSEPAASIDEVPADAPGRDKLEAVVGIDALADSTGTETTTPSTAPESTDGAAPITDNPSATTAPEAAPPTTPATSDEGSGNTGAIVLAVVVGLIVLVGGGLMVRNRSQS